MRVGCTSASLFYHYDGLGSTRALSDENGTLTDSYDYEAFDTLLNQAGTTENSYLFTGEQFDQSLNQYYLRARYYDQKIGRFTQMDTWMGNNHDPVTLHKYLYANADPGNLIDPTGNFSIGSLMSTVNTAARLANTATNAMSLVDFFDFTSAFDSGLNKKVTSQGRGKLAILSMLGKVGDKLFRGIAKKCKKKNSFTAGTLVTTSRGFIPIEEVVIGDYVLSFNEAERLTEYQQVEHLIQHTEVEVVFDVELITGEVIEATQGHPFYVNSKWIEVEKLNVGDELSLPNSSVKIKGISHYARESTFYNLTIASNHNYYVGVDQVLVHNISSVCGSFNNHVNGAIAEWRGYGSALAQGHIGIMMPGMLTATGPDFITYDQRNRRIVVWDAKYKKSGKGFPKTLSQKKLTAWMPFVINKIHKLPDDADKAKILAALNSGRVRGQIFKWPP